MKSARPTKWSRGMVAAAFGLGALGLTAMASCTYIVADELIDWNSDRAHRRACEADERRQNQPDDGKMREIPQGCWELR